MRRTLAAGAALALLAGCVGGGTKTVTSVVRTQTTKIEAVKSAGTTGSRTNFDPRAIYRAEAPGVVTVVAEIGNSGVALGSGFVVDTSGYIATNAHVVTGNSNQKARRVWVQFADGNQVSGNVIGIDLDSDVSLVKIDPGTLRGSAHLVALPFGSTKALAVGDPVAAIGSPFGRQESLSVGVVSALHRDIQSLTKFDIGNAIQTDAAINHGNSGGPLLDSGGRVIGINAQIASSNGGGEGVGFAIPVETIKHSIAQLRATGQVRYAYLGISSVSLYPQLAERLGLGDVQGVLVDSVAPGGPAAKAGLRGSKSHIDFQDEPNVPVGSDVITGVDGHKVTQAQDLSDLIGQHQPGQTVTLQIVRGGKPRTVTVTLGTRPGGAH